MPRLLIAISAHGLGHLGQAAPVCNALAELCPELNLTIWSAVPAHRLRQRIHIPFAHINEACDIGFMMHDAMQVNVPDSWALYHDRECHWPRHLEAARTLVARCRPDLIVSDVGEMPLAAGQALGIPTIAMSSLNWADMAQFYFHRLVGSAPIIDRLRKIYDHTTLALRLSPGMPMRGQAEQRLPPVGSVSLLTRQAIDADLLAELPYPDQPRLLIGLGGIETGLPLANWPQQSRLNLLVANQKGLPAHGDPARGIINADTLRARFGWNFCDLLACCDAVVCKPGYGTFVEAALAATPVLYVSRNDWPEQPVLISWLLEHARCAELSQTQLQQGDFQQALEMLRARPKLPPIPRDGARVAARAILVLTGWSEIEAKGLQQQGGVVHG